MVRPTVSPQQAGRQQLSDTTDSLTLRPCSIQGDSPKRTTKEDSMTQLPPAPRDTDSFVRARGLLKHQSRRKTHDRGESGQPRDSVHELGWWRPDPHGGAMPMSSHDLHHAAARTEGRNHRRRHRSGHRGTDSSGRSEPGHPAPPPTGVYRRKGLTLTVLEEWTVIDGASFGKPQRDRNLLCNLCVSQCLVYRDALLG